MKTRKILALVLSLVMVFSLCSTAFAAHLTNEVTELEQANSDLSMYLATQGYVLLENNGVLPLEQKGADKVVALFGSAAETTIKGGTGSGAVNNRRNDNIDEALVAAGWEIADQTWLKRMEATSGSPKTDLAITDAEIAEATAKTDLAIYAISRQAGEGTDRYLDSGNGSYMLTAVELANIKKIVDNFDKVIFVFNTLVMDTSWMQEYSADDIDAVVYMANGGQRGSEALVKVLEGEVTPSGKLTDTWPINYSDYPSADTFSHRDGNTSTEYYEDGIYVGYRYFDTFGLDVTWEFGYGMSYTTFDINVVDVAVSGEKVEVTVDVTNVGDTYSGKEVVEVYFSAPDGELEKPYQELAAYGKTDELAPGKKQTLTLSYATTDMSSYSEARAAYIMEAGQYIIRVGNSSRNTHVAATVTLDKLVETELLVNQVEAEIEFDEISKADATPITYAGEAEEIANAPKFVLDAEKVPVVDNREALKALDTETVTTYLFAADAENYKARDEITLQTRTVGGIMNNRKSEPAESINVTGSGRYVKLNLGNANTQYGFSIWEFTIYGKQGDGETAIISQKKPAEVSSCETIDMNNQYHPAEHINDGDWNTRWGAGWNNSKPEQAPTPTESWVIIDLEDTYDIQKIAIDWETAYGKKIEVQVSNDKETWTTIYSYEGSLPITGISVSSNGGAVGGYSTTTYKEVVEIVDALPEGITKETAKLTDVYNGKITMKQFVACLKAEEMARLCVGGAGSVQASPDGSMIGGSASSVNGGAGQTTQELYQTRHIPAMPNADGPAGIRITQSYSAFNANQSFKVSGTGRYVRLFLTQPATQYGFSIYEFIVYGSQNGGAASIVSTGKTTYANSEGTYNTPAYSKDLVNDGNPSTRWGTNYNNADGKDNCWITIDLGETYDISRVDVMWEAAYSKAYQVQVSDDNATWTTIYNATNSGKTQYQYCTAFPAGTCMAMTWDADAIVQEGIGVGAEMIEYGVTTWLAPGMNIHRNPLCGRNFEYYSEDPLVAGVTAGYVTAGVQSYSGIGTTIKHFWGNSQENSRTTVNNVISERAAREIYLKNFEIAVKLAQPQCIMTCYNENNGWPGADSWDSCTDLARGEWGFKGYIMTDWGGGQSTQYISMHAGNDMIMPGGNASVILNGMPKTNEDGSINYAGEGRGTIALGDLQKSAIAVLNVDLQSQDMEKMLADAFDIEYEAGSYSDNNGAMLSEGWTMTEKSAVEDYAIVIEDVNVSGDEAAVPVYFKGESDVQGITMEINSELPIKAVKADGFSYVNGNKVVVASGSAMDKSEPLFTVIFDTSDAIGEYAVSGRVIEFVNGNDKLANNPVVLSGTVIAARMGDVDMDGQVTTVDLVKIARYIIDAEELTPVQIKLADIDGDGVITTADLVKLARMIVAE